jgi:CSLREA domain-containing protein
MSSIPGRGLLRPIPKSLISRSDLDLRFRLRLIASFALLLVGFLTLSGPNPASAQGVIFVTSLEDKVNGIGGCSLQEAIYAANRNDNTAIISYGPFGNPNLVTTQCLPGQGDHNRIILPVQAVFHLNQVVLDYLNPFGATATPMVSSNITIEANGSTLQWTGSRNARAFAVSSTGNLILLDIYIRDFHFKGGDGRSGGGGGMGAGGAIYVKGDGRLLVERSTFSGNSAAGGNGAAIAFGGGGGGMGGNGGSGPTSVVSSANGGGGGGAIGNGRSDLPVGVSGGGGTILDAGLAISPGISPEFQPGFACGGKGGGVEEDGGDATCPGGGGGGGGFSVDLLAGNGGNGNYAGGGGGGGLSSNGDKANGGKGGFGGGGGAGWQDDSGGCGSGSSGGDGGFGGGGGAGPGGQLSGGPGHGGAFGGDARCVNGGGGAALGGAIFSDGGSVTVRNSTLTGNFAVRGLGGSAGTPGAADNGADAGGAIYSWHGSLEIRNSTITANQGTGSLAGVAVSGANFLLFNTIISNNGAQECAIGTDSIVNGAGNLIQTNVDCPGVVSTSDPQLGPLQDNTGPTPTMAISKFSPAFDSADANTSLSIDQRGFPRPQENGFDIGAFELCVPQGILGLNCLIPPEINPSGPGIVNLTIQVSPPGTGTTIPVPGNYPEALNSVVVVAAIPNPGYGLVNWTGGVADPTNPSTTVIIDQGKTITANFAPLGATMFGNIISKSGPSNARVWTLSLLDNGPGATNSVTIHDFTLTQTSGAACTPVLKNAASFPLLLGNLGPSQTGTNTIRLDFTGCTASARFTAKFTYSANNGAVSGFVTRTNQYQ